MSEEVTTIKITKTTKERLAAHGRMGDSYEEVLVKILNRLDVLETELAKNSANSIQ
ncbi:MAG: hypothetical protein JW986_03185 [Methanotrichaceae archaeon]|nr:hypothetical protein [Methanotrichaceae archaeon]